MNVFQGVTLTILGLAIVRELILFRRGPVSRGAWLLRVCVWLGAAVAIADPGLTSRVAQSVGINRGADLISYSFILAFLVVSFYFYARCARLQRQLTEVIRHLAIQEARRGEEGSR
ncbi:MAG: DUF2304 domain-containing protein [Planctomycetes bacterium]|nr:DUF2304 domain-containing protein [Planctomycetota bacterium]